MIYVDFRKELVSKAENAFSSRGWKIELFLEGDSSTNQTDMEFIRQTNIKYFSNTNEVLGGDFLRMTKKRSDGSAYFCRFEVKYLYDEYNRKGWDKIFNIIDVNVRSVDDDELQANSLNSFEEINNRLIARPLNYDANKSELNGHVFRQIGDFVIVLYMLVSESKHDLTSFKIPESLLNDWGISNDQALDRAIENSSVLFPPLIYLSKARIVDETLLGMSYLPFDVDNSTVGKMDTLVVTTTKQSNGSVAFFYPDMREKLYKSFGKEDYYVVFTATTEFHLHRCSEFDLKDIQDSLRESNKRFPEESLSHLVYRYYGDRKELLPIYD